MVVIDESVWDEMIRFDRTSNRSLLGRVLNLFLETTPEPNGRNLECVFGAWRWSDGRKVGGPLPQVELPSRRRVSPRRALPEDGAASD